MILRLAAALCALVVLASGLGEAASVDDVAPAARAGPSPDPEPSPGSSVEPTPHVLSVTLPEGLPRAQLYWDRGGGYRFLDATTVKLEENGVPHFGLGEQPLLEGHVGFRLHVDAAGFVEHGDVEPGDDRVEVRRAFLTTNGEVHLLHPVQYNLEIGLLGGQFYVDSAWIMVRNLPWIGTLKVGALDAPMGFDNVVSSRDRTFMELPAPLEAFVPATSPGILARDTLSGQRGTWSLGWFTVGQRRDVGDRSRALARVVGRTTWLLHDEAIDDGRGGAGRWWPLLQVGLGASYTFAGSHEVQYQSRPESFLAPIAIDTGRISGKQAFIIDPELAARRGPLSLQAEYLHTFVDGGVENFAGLYVQVAYLLTGEVRPYNREGAVFGQVIPRRSLDWRTRGFGAFEIAARYSWTNLDHSPVAGGRMSILSSGLNWYWNRYVRWQLNHELAFIDSDSRDGRLNVFQARFQLVF
jgi:phosphate-selective porin OprO/OprP